MSTIENDTYHGLNVQQLEQAYESMDSNTMWGSLLKRTRSNEKMYPVPDNRFISLLLNDQFLSDKHKLLSKKLAADVENIINNGKLNSYKIWYDGSDMSCVYKVTIAPDAYESDAPDSLKGYEFVFVIRRSSTDLERQLKHELDEVYDNKIQNRVFDVKNRRMVINLYITDDMMCDMSIASVIQYAMIRFEIDEAFYHGKDIDEIEVTPLEQEGAKNDGIFINELTHNSEYNEEMASFRLMYHIRSLCNGIEIKERASRITDELEIVHRMMGNDYSLKFLLLHCPLFRDTMSSYYQIEKLLSENSIYDLLEDADHFLDNIFNPTESGLLAQVKRARHYQEFQFYKLLSDWAFGQYNCLSMGLIDPHEYFMED